MSTTTLRFSLLGAISYRNPLIFADKTLFASCSHIFNATQLADMMRGIHSSSNSILEALNAQHQSEMNTIKLQLEELTSETVRLLQRYEGKRLVKKDVRTLTGVVQRIVPNTCPPQLCVMWRHNALCANISMTDLFTEFEVEN